MILFIFYHRKELNLQAFSHTLRNNGKQLRFEASATGTQEQSRPNLEVFVCNSRGTLNFSVPFAIFLQFQELVQGHFLGAF